MSTRLEIANKIMLNCGQRELSDTTTTLKGKLVANVIESGLQKLCRDNVWTWTQNRVTSSSWSTETATLATDVTQVRAVTYYDNDASVYRPVRFLDPQAFDQLELEAYLNTTSIHPLYWTFGNGVNKVRVNPYPNDATARSRIYFYVTNFTALPATDATSMGLPLDMEEPLVLLCSALYMRRQQEDPVMAQEFEREYNEAVTRIRSKQLTRPGEAITTYKGRRKSAYEYLP